MEVCSKYYELKLFDTQSEYAGVLLIFLNRIGIEALEIFSHIWADYLLKSS